MILKDFDYIYKMHTKDYIIKSPCYVLFILISELLSVSV